MDSIYYTRVLLPAFLGVSPEGSLLLLPTLPTRWKGTQYSVHSLSKRG